MQVLLIAIILLLSVAPCFIDAMEKTKQTKTKKQDEIIAHRRKRLENGANPDLPDNEGVTPLMTAAEAGDIKGMKLLFEFHANPNIQNSLNNCTALFYAVIGHQKEAVALLLEAGCDRTLTNNAGRTAEDLAKVLGNKEILALLQKK